jgi:N-acetylglutamate synthase-like GNAT family acetyltransferase
VTQLDIHMPDILMETNGILDLWIAARCNGPMEIEVRPLRTAEDAEAFRRLNLEWIGAHFTVEEQDRRQLADPVAAYVEPGGEILMAELDGTVGGCVAIVPDGTGAFELSKMAVAPELRGHGAGRRLLNAAVDRARELGATSLFLGSSTGLEAAVHLYEAVGFRHVPRESIHMPYARASVFMRMELEPAGATATS